MGRNNKKTAVITGGSRGIGAATAILLAEKGCNVVVNYVHSKEKAYSLCDSLAKRGLSCAPFMADVSVRANAIDLIDFALNTFGGADILINNAGIARQKLFTDITPGEWDEMFAVHVDGAFHCCQAALSYMIKEKSGSIVNVASIWGITGASCEVHYSAAKAALIGFTKALAKELGPSGIRVNCVAPGVVDTDMNCGIPADSLQEIYQSTPLCRMGTPEEIARCVSFLCFDDAAFLTGQVISPNGGLLV